MISEPPTPSAAGEPASARISASITMAALVLSYSLVGVVVLFGDSWIVATAPGAADIGFVWWPMRFGYALLAPGALILVVTALVLGTRARSRTACLLAVTALFALIAVAMTARVVAF